MKKPLPKIFLFLFLSVSLLCLLVPWMKDSFSNIQSSSPASALTVSDARNLLAPVPLDDSKQNKPFYDLILIIFSGDGNKAISKRDQLREVYKKYVTGINYADGQGTVFYSVKVLFLVSHNAASEESDIIGDIMYVKCPPGYWNIVLKTKAMLSVVNHFDSRFILKADDDTYVCLYRVVSLLHSVPEKKKDKVYGGIPTACGLDSNPYIGHVIKDPSHKWYDDKFVKHTLGGLDCFPAYHQGAFYLLSTALVQFLHQSRDHLLTFINEDVTMGTWLIGIDREMIAFNSFSDARLWECTCSIWTPWLQYDKNAFFHNCKSIAQLRACSQLMPYC